MSRTRARRSKQAHNPTPPASSYLGLTGTQSHLDPIQRWKRSVVSVGLFLVFVVEFGEFVLSKIWRAANELWHVVAPWLAS